MFNLVSGPSCVNDRIIQHTSDLDALNGHIKHSPQIRPGDSNFLPYLGNGHFGLSLSDTGKSARVKSKFSTGHSFDFTGL